MRRFEIMLVVIGLIAATFAGAEEFEPVLFPMLLATPAPGAAGALWTTTAFIRVAGPGYIYDNFPCQIGPPTFPAPPPMPCPPGFSWIGPGTTVPLRRDAPHGYLRWVPVSSEGLFFSLHVSDLSRPDQPSIELPVVRMADLFEGQIEFASIPLDAPNRTLLRIYNMQPRQNQALRVTVRPHESAFMPVSVELTLAPNLMLVEYSQRPAYAELYLDRLYPASLPGGALVRIESVDPTLEFWGFITVTNDVSHGVTTYAPW